MNWHKRLTQAREAKGIKKSAFAKMVDVSAPTVTDWENGNTRMIEGANLMKVCSTLNVTPEWLLHGVESITELFPGAMRVVAHDDSERIETEYRIPMVQLRLQAGHTGYKTEPDTLDGGTMGISKRWADAKEYNPSRLIAIRVKGESMEPTLYENDVVVINLDETKPVDNGVFAVNYDGEAVVKRMSRDLGQWWLMSDNSDQRRFYRRACKGEECIIIGRIVRREGDHF
jgi:phage repressor protein C with HTH and peptisase S24 domain